jgi:hypothetical protein
MATFEVHDEAAVQAKLPNMTYCESFRNRFLYEISCQNSAGVGKRGISTPRILLVSMSVCFPSWKISKILSVQGSPGRSA